MANNSNNAVMLKIAEEYERRDLEDLCKIQKTYPTADALLKAAVASAFPGAVKAESD